MQQARQDRFATLALLAGVGAGTALLWWRFNAVPPARGVYPSDLINYFLPRAEGVAARLAQGELPLWNPYGCSGFPDLATMQHAVFYPGTWLNAWLGVATAIPLRLFAECLLGGWAAAGLARAWGVGVPAAVLAGIVLVASCLIGQSFWPPEVSTLFFVPWIWLCVERLVASFRWRWWLGLVFGTALQLCAGFPQFALYGYYLIAPYAALRLYETRSDPDAAPLSRAALLALGVILGTGLAGVQLGPTWALTGESLRQGALDARAAEYLGGMGAPLAGALANAVDPGPKPLAFDFRGGGGYLGIATLLLVALGAVSIPLRRAAFFAVAAGVGLLLSDGADGIGSGLYQLYVSLPTGDVFRTPERLRLLTWLSAIALATFGLDSVCRGFPGCSPWRIAAALAAAGCVAASVAVFGAEGAAWRAGLALALVGASWRLARFPRLAVLAPSLLVGFVLLDLTAATRPQGSLRSLPVDWSRTYHLLGHAVAEPEALERLRADAGPQRVALPTASPYTGGPGAGAFFRPSCYEPLAPSAWGALERAYGPGPGSGQLFLRADPLRHAGLFDVASVRWIVDAPPGLGSSPEALREALRTTRDRYVAGAPPVPVELGTTRPWIENPDALPRAYWIGRSVRGSQADALRHVAGSSFDFAAAVWLENAEPELATPGGLVPAQISDYAPERVAVQVEGPGRGWLVLTDTWFPGWVADVDGASAPIARANGLYRAVAVPAGRHEVVFRYEPTSLRWGAGISAASFAITLALPALARRRQRRRLRQRAPTG